MSDDRKNQVDAQIAQILREVDTSFADIRDEESAKGLAKAVYQRLLDRWYRFARFGIVSRSELTAIEVGVKFSPDDGVTALMVSIGLTPLAVR